MFGVPVQLTYKRQKKFNTSCGGCLSILMVIGLTSYFAFELHHEYANPTYTSTSLTIDYTKQNDYEFFMQP